MIGSDFLAGAADRWRAIQGGNADTPQEVMRTARAASATDTTLQPAEQRDKRVDRLNRTAARQTARALVLAADVAPRTERSQHDVIESLRHERVIGSSDLIDVNFLELAIAVARGVGRIRVGSGFGSGFLVGPGVLMTNHHVIGNEDSGQQAVVQLDYQDNASGQMLPIQTFRLEPGRFFMSDKNLDFTIIGVSPESNNGTLLTSYPWVKLIGETGKAEAGDFVNIIQHPRGGLKQIAFRANQVIALPDRNRDFLFYTTDTEPGSSGSPCFNDQWELIALHHSGVLATDGQGRFLTKDKKPWREGVDDPRLLDWVANEGVRVSAIVSFIKTAPIRTEWRDKRDELLSERPPNPIELARAMNAESPLTSRRGVPSSGTTAKGATMDSTYTWNIPLQVTVSLGTPQGASVETVGVPSSAAAPGRIAMAEEAVVIDPDWSAREGYDQGFLGMSIPLPLLSEAMKATSAEVPPEYRKNGDRYTLHYHNYSVVMHKQRRFAWFSAANVDGDRRHTLPKRKDKWFIDPRIDDPADPKIQCGEELYATGDTDRGHLTRYLDAAWGDSKDAAIRSVNDTFHFTALPGFVWVGRDGTRVCSGRGGSEPCATWSCIGRCWG